MRAQEKEVRANVIERLKTMYEQEGYSVKGVRDVELLLIWSMVNHKEQVFGMGWDKEIVAYIKSDVKRLNKLRTQSYKYNLLSGVSREELMKSSEMEMV